MSPHGYAETLRQLPQPTRFDLLEIRELGDDRVFTYDVAFGDTTMRVTLAVAPDQKLSQFAIWPRPAM